MIFVVSFNIKYGSINFFVQREKYLYIQQFNLSDWLYVEEFWDIYFVYRSCCCCLFLKVIGVIDEKLIKSWIVVIVL